MKITFVVRLHSHNGDRLGFYVPKSVFEFYKLKPQDIEGNIKWLHNYGLGNILYFPQLPPGSKLYPHPNGLRGVIPRNHFMPEAGTLVELTIAVA